MRPLAALVLVVLVIGLIGTGCGSSGTTATTTSAAAKEAQQRWLVGLRAWSHKMRLTLDGISVLFTSPESVRGIEGGSRNVDAQLARYVNTLATCSVLVRALDPTPVALGLARHYALRACESLEAGARLIREGVKQVQDGDGSSLLNQATIPLSAGQSDLAVAVSSAVTANP
jgi:hypothetical protein